MEAVIEGLSGFSNVITGMDGKANADSLAEGLVNWDGVEVAVRDPDEDDEAGDDARDEPGLEVVGLDEASGFVEDGVFEEEPSEPEPEGFLASSTKTLVLSSLPLSAESKRSPLEDKGDAKDEGEGWLKPKLIVA